MLRLAAAFFLLLFSASFLSSCAKPGPWTIAPSGRIRDQVIAESSGVVASRRFSEILWTHNDSGNPADIYAINREGELIRSYGLKDVVNQDWEDIAIDSTNNLYVLENSSRRDDQARSFVYVVSEPDPYRDSEPEIPIIRTLALTFPEGPNDCETLFVWQRELFLVTKPWDGSLPRIYSFDLARTEGQARLLGEVPVHAMITGGDISPDGKKIMLVSYVALLLFQGDLPPGKLLQTSPRILRLNARQVEAVAWKEDRIVLTNEQRDLFELSRKELRDLKAPFLRTPRVNIPRLEEAPTVEQSFSEWPKGRWLKARKGISEVEIGRAAWSSAGLHIGLDPPAGFALRELPEIFSPADYDDWFRPGGVYILLNPDGSRPLAYGSHDRCLTVGRNRQGKIEVAAHRLRPATLIESSETQPVWVSTSEESGRILLTVRPGVFELDLEAEEDRQIGFNIILVENDGSLLSWAPLSQRFTWDAPSIWGLIILED